MEEPWAARIFGLVVLAAVLALFGSRKYRFKRHWERGVRALEQGDLPLAERCLRRCLRIVPSSAAIRQTLGAVLAQCNRLGEAEELYSLAAQLEPRNPNGYLHLGLFLALISRNREEDAITAFEKAIELAPDVRNFLGHEPRLARLRGYPRFDALLVPAPPTPSD